MAPEELPLPVEAERAPVEEHLHPGRAGRLRRVDGPDEEPQRVEARPREGGEPHPPGGEEDPLAECGQQPGGLGERSGGVPAVTVLGDPAGPAEGEEGNMGQGGGLGGVPAHGGGEGMGGVDEGVHVVLTHPGGEPLGAAEPADTHLTRRQPGAATRPASEVVTRTLRSPARLSASRRASVVPPRTRTCTAAGTGIGTDSSRERAETQGGRSAQLSTPVCAPAGRPAPVRRRRRRPRTRRS